MKGIAKTAVALALAAPLAAPAYAQNLVKERANITNVDWNTMEVELKDPKGRVTTWKVRRDATVSFKDKREQFPNPKLGDLRAPMYVHFTYDGDTKEITRFEVAEVGFDPAAGGPGTTVSAVITALDEKVGHVEVRMGSGVKTFEVDPKSQLGAFKVGDRVNLLIAKEGSKEVVTQIRRQ